MLKHAGVYCSDMVASGDTTIRLSRGTKTRIDEVRPYESLTYDEFINELVNVYEQVSATEMNRPT